MPALPASTVIAAEEPVTVIEPKKMLSLITALVEPVPTCIR